jgi:hypothetical protein
MLDIYLSKLQNFNQLIRVIEYFLKIIIEINQNGNEEFKQKKQNIKINQILIEFVETDL